MQSAAGGTSQRLKPAVAIVRSLSRNPAPAPDAVPALLIVVIETSPAAALHGACLPSSIPFQPRRHGPAFRLLPRTTLRSARDRQARPKIPTPDVTGYARYRRRPRSENAPAPDRALPGHDSTSAAQRTMPIGTERGTGVDRQKVGINQSVYLAAPIDLNFLSSHWLSRS